MNCDVLKTQLPDLLLDAAFAGSDAGVRAHKHLAECPACAEQLQSLRATMQLMDLWQAPEPSAYFDTRMQSKMREELAAPSGFWQRLTARLAGITAHSMKPVVAGVMAVTVIIGGATYAGVSFFEQPHANVEESATLRDLQSLDHNEQTIDDLNSLDQQLNDTGGNGTE